MPKAQKGVLVQCDPSIKTLIVTLDNKHHEYIIEDLDDGTLFIKAEKLAELKDKLTERLKDTMMEVDDSESD